MINESEKKYDYMERDAFNKKNQKTYGIFHMFFQREKSKMVECMQQAASATLSGILFPVPLT